ncbi:uncharacterized protein LOC130898559 [Diorhabda carinulata]|uniref:uncharacterized protein LOC130898559 n=1 Tax=Diorhabda carinulata TaxID=1163345 RepID=UPI0025A2DF06|nr:uncharacterized protein LOC130898559 [Diorhabda carinulata]XP_057663928.1 uncharacterized protein LOC130898559 [Diorhabda carinulata]
MDSSFSCIDGDECAKLIKKYKKEMTKTKPNDKSKTSNERNSKCSMDLFDDDSKNDDTNKFMELRKTMNKFNDLSSNHTSLDKLSLYFKIGSDKGHYITNESYVRIPRLSPSKTSRSAMDTITLDMAFHHRTEKKPLTQFNTCSKYLGEWNALGMAGEGIYRYPHGVIYDGNFNANGLYHGRGTLIYPNGQRFRGIWSNGKLTDSSHFSSVDISAAKRSTEKVKFSLPDRRYPCEVINGFGVPGNEILTNQQPTPEIPMNCYDVISGVFNPEDGYVASYMDKHKTTKKSATTRGSNSMDRSYEEYENLMRTGTEEDCEVEMWFKRINQDPVCIDNQLIIDIPSIEKAKWIQKYCRSNPEQPTGYNPLLYEVFTTGTKKELSDIQKFGTLKNIDVTISSEPPSDSVVTQKKTISFIQKVIKEKRKKNYEGGPRVKKKSLLKKGIIAPFSKMSEDMSSVEKDLLLFYNPVTSLRRRSLAASFPGRYGMEPTRGSDDEMLRVIHELLATDQIVTRSDYNVRDSDTGEPKSYSDANDILGKNITRELSSPITFEMETLMTPINNEQFEDNKTVE